MTPLQNSHPLKSIEISLMNMAQRTVNAENSFVENIMQRVDCSADDARKVLALYLKLKIAKFDLNSNSVKIKHGGFFDVPVILRALEQVA